MSRICLVPVAASARICTPYSCLNFFEFLTLIAPHTCQCMWYLRRCKSASMCVKGACLCLYLVLVLSQAWIITVAEPSSDAHLSHAWHCRQPERRHGSGGGGPLRHSFGIVLWSEPARPARSYHLPLHLAHVGVCCLVIPHAPNGPWGSRGRRCHICHGCPRHHITYRAAAGVNATPASVMVVVIMPKSGIHRRLYG